MLYNQHTLIRGYYMNIPDYVYLETIGSRIKAFNPKVIKTLRLSRFMNISQKKSSKNTQGEFLLFYCL